MAVTRSSKWMFCGEMHALDAPLSITPLGSEASVKKAFEPTVTPTSMTVGGGAGSRGARG